jgi:hypothetical protein
LNNTTNPSLISPDSPKILLKGVEAPRNSLELDDSSNGAISKSPPRIIKDESLNFPMGIQIKTSMDARSSKTEEYSSELSNSPGTKTPSLVARLMGLDLLPESSSPSSSSVPKSTRLHRQIQNLKEDMRSKKSSGTRSLPETPRVSSARKSDVVDHHRFSLQSNKENNDEIEFSSYLTAKMTRRIVQEDENRSPGHYARQIVKQVKENMSRRVGTDITNAVKNREQRRDQELVVLLKSKKKVNRPVSNGEESCSPRLRLIELKENKAVNCSNLHPPKLSPSPLSSTCTVDNKPKILKKTINERCGKKAGGEKYNSRLKKSPQQSSGKLRNKQDEPFVRSPPKIKSEKICKKTPLSSNILHINVPKIQGKRQSSQVNDSQSSERRSRSQLSRNLSESYESETTTYTLYGFQEKSNFSSELEYITTILRRTGLDTGTSVSFTKWHSPSHPLDPLIFDHLEISRHVITTSSTSALHHRTNRKLIFELVDELLGEILKPLLNLKPWIPSIACDGRMNGWELIGRLCSRIRGFPSADCRVLEDIDGLIDGDLGRMVTEGEEESEEIVTEVEREITALMVHETVMTIWGIQET